MATPAELYVDGVKKKLRYYYAAWLPTAELRLGDVGVLEGNFFHRKRNLRDMGIDFDVLDDTRPSTLDVVSEQGVSIAFKVAGEVDPKLPSVPQAEAGVGVSFGREGAFVIQATDVYEPSIRDLGALERAIIEAWHRGDWERAWVVVVRLVRSANALILVSQSSGARVEMSVSGKAVAGPIHLADAGVSLHVRHQVGDIVRVDRAQEVTPLFQLARLERRFLRDPDLRVTKQGAGDGREAGPPGADEGDGPLGLQLLE